MLELFETQFFQAWNTKLSDFQKLYSCACATIALPAPSRSSWRGLFPTTSACSSTPPNERGDRPFDAHLLHSLPDTSSKEIEALANSLGKTSENGQLTMISMGQGQEPFASCSGQVHQAWRLGVPRQRG